MSSQELRLYPAAWSQIQMRLQTLRIDHHFSEDEIFCIPLHIIKKDKVTFQIHRKLMELLKEVSPVEREEIEFLQLNEVHRMAVVSAGGVESFLFARMLKKIICKLKGFDTNCEAFYVELIMDAIETAIKRADPERVLEDFTPPTIEILSGNFTVSFEVESEPPLKFQGNNIDRLLKDICKEIPMQMLKKE